MDFVIEEAVARGQRQVGPAAVVGPAARRREARRTRQRRHDRVLVVMIVEIVIGVELQPFEIFLQDEVDHARDRVRSIDRRGTAGQHVDALQQRCRDDARVLAVLRAQALAVDQHQRALEAQAAQLDALAPVGIVIGLLRVRRDLRQAVQHVLDVHRGLCADVGGGHRGDRRGGGDVGADDARARHDDIATRLRGRRRLARGGRGLGGGFLRRLSDIGIVGRGGLCQRGCAHHRQAACQRHERNPILPNHSLASHRGSLPWSLFTSDKFSYPGDGVNTAVIPLHTILSPL